MTASFERYMERITAGERLSPDDIRDLATTPDILPLGMLADTLRRRMHGTRATFVRVASGAFDQPFADTMPASARELRITGSPGTLAMAITGVQNARAAAGERVVSAFSWSDIERLAGGHERISAALEQLKDAGLDALAELPVDAIPDLQVAIERLVAAGFPQLRLTVDRAPAAQRTGLLLRAFELQERFACVQAINPLPMASSAYRPTTGYEDVKMVALARLAVPNVPTVQVDWQRYGPKLAQVVLAFGADDVYGVSASDDAGEGRRRAPLEEILRNIEAAGFEPVERDGRFMQVSAFGLQPSATGARSPAPEADKE
jgi:aminodeoxyfutalosine synthase